jgi:hypothetical protein
LAVGWRGAGCDRRCHRLQYANWFVVSNGEDKWKGRGRKRAWSTIPADAWRDWKEHGNLSPDTRSVTWQSIRAFLNIQHDYEPLAWKVPSNGSFVLKDDWDCLT